MEETYETLLRAGYRHAMKNGVSRREQEDCAVKFLELMLQKYGSYEVLARICKESPALIEKCARDHAIDYLRTLNNRYEIIEADTIRSDGNSEIFDSQSNAPAPGDALEKAEYWLKIEKAAHADLSPAEYETLLRHYRDEMTHKEIAAATGQTAGAVKMAIKRALKKLKRDAAKLGIQESELREYLPESTPPPPYIYQVSKRRKYKT